MKKNISNLLIIFFLFTLCFQTFANGTKSSQTNAKRAKTVIIYTYDSFIAEWGPGPDLQKMFESKTGYKIEYVNCGDGAQILSKAILEKKNPESDILLGLDNNTIYKARNEKVLASYKPKDADSIIPEQFHEALGNDWELTPYDYNHFSIIYDTKSNVPEPKSIEDLIKPVYKKKLILMDPRTSTPGLGFVVWTLGIFGQNYTDYWKSLKNSILTMAPGWSAGYGLFTKGEAPLVISYATDTAYNVQCENSDRYKALVFKEGQPEQIEGAGITNGAKNINGAKAFIDFLISEDAQKVIPLTQWMYPVNKNVELPDCYKNYAPIPAKTITADHSKTETAVSTIMEILQ